MRHIAIVAGGDSSESEVSLRSAEGIRSFLAKDKYKSTLVRISGQVWEAVLSDTEVYPIDKNNFSYTKAGEIFTFDFAYITVHGAPGENGALQAYFDLIGLKYSCCDVFAAALSYNKFACNRYLESFGARVAQSVLLRKNEQLPPEHLVNMVGLPCFIKSNVGGSSFGVSKVKEISQVQDAIDRALKEGGDVIVESFLQGTELTCGMYKTKEKTVRLPLAEVVSENDFFDYDAKYKGEVQEIIPARISQHDTLEIQKQTASYYEILGCKGIIRVDYILTKDGPCVLEVNTTPGMTETSFIPQQVAAAGLNMQDVLEDIIENEFSN